MCDSGDSEVFCLSPAIHYISREDTVPTRVIQREWAAKFLRHQSPCSLPSVTDPHQKAWLHTELLFSV